MFKEIVLLRGDHNESYENFEMRIKDQAESLMQENSFLKVKIALTVEKPPKFSVIPFKTGKISLISFYSKEESNSIDSTIFSSLSGFSGAYKVEEALPVSYVKNWPDRALTPGVCLLTLFRKKEDLGYDTFIDRWHNGHTPLSLKIHPLWHYSRNVIHKKLSNDSEDWDGIVDEHFKSRSDLINPFKFFGNPLFIVPRMLKVYIDVKSFLDYGSIETFLTREICLKS